MTKWAQRAVILVFFGFLAGFGLAHLLLPDRSFSPVENRFLSEAPAFSWEALRSGAYTSALETWLADQFPLRDGWMGLKTRYEYALGQRQFHGVCVCGDTLISLTEDGGMGERNLKHVQALTERVGMPVYLALIPTADEVWRDRLPEGVERFDQAAFLERARTATDARWVDVSGVLNGNKEEEIYYRTDHHWTSLGAYCGYTALMEAMGLDAAPLGEGETVSEDFCGSLYSVSGVHWLAPDVIRRYVSGEGVTVEDVEAGESRGLYVDGFLGGKDQYASFLGGNAPLYIVRNASADGGTLLLVRDSFSDSLAPFLSESFSEVHLLDLRYARVPVARYAQEHGLDAIAVCCSVDTFLSGEELVFLGK